MKVFNIHATLACLLMASASARALSKKDESKGNNKAEVIQVISYASFVDLFPSLSGFDILEGGSDSGSDRRRLQEKRKLGGYGYYGFTFLEWSLAINTLLPDCTLAPVRSADELDLTFLGLAAGPMQYSEREVDRDDLDSILVGVFKDYDKALECAIEDDSEDCLEDWKTFHGDVDKDSDLWGRKEPNGTDGTDGSSLATVASLGLNRRGKKVILFDNAATAVFSLAAIRCEIGGDSTFGEMLQVKGRRGGGRK